MFQGAYTTEFYRALADALHAEVRDGGAAADARLGQRAGAERNFRTPSASPLWTSC